MLICCIRWLCDWSFRLLPHSQHLLFCCVLSILDLIWLILMALFCVAIRIDSVSLLRFPFLNQIHVFLCEISLVSRLKYPLSCFSSHFYFLVIVVLLVFVSSVFFWWLSSSTLSYVVFESLYWGVNAIFSTGKSSSSFFYWHIICQRHLWDVRSLGFLFSSQSFEVLLWSTSKFLRGGQPRYYLFDKVLAIYVSLVSSSFLVLLRYSF